MEIDITPFKIGQRVEIAEVPSKMKGIIKIDPSYFKGYFIVRNYIPKDKMTKIGDDLNIVVENIENFTLNRFNKRHLKKYGNK